MKKVNIEDRKVQKVSEVLDELNKDIGTDGKLIVVYSSKDGSVRTLMANVTIAETVAFVEFCKLSLFNSIMSREV